MVWVEASHSLFLQGAGESSTDTGLCVAEVDDRLARLGVVAAMEGATGGGGTGGC